MVHKPANTAELERRVAQAHADAIQREFGSLLEVRDNYPKIVLYQQGIFKGNYEGIPAIKIEDWLQPQ